jgi:hypothetical protein
MRKGKTPRVRDAQHLAGPTGAAPVANPCKSGKPQRQPPTGHCTGQQSPLSGHPARWCLDCGVETTAINEYYLVHDTLWLSVMPDRRGILCVGCLAGRLGRPLVPADFRITPAEMLRRLALIRQGDLGPFE